MPISPSALSRMVEKIFSDLHLEGAEISVVLCEDELIAQLNETYLGRKGPTNVLSFPMDYGKQGLDEGQPLLLGDVVVNVQRATTDAAEAGVEPLSEVAFLVIHGICHLAGYDHEGPDAQKAAQTESVEAGLHERFGSILISSRKE